MEQYRITVIVEKLEMNGGAIPVQRAQSDAMIDDRTWGMTSRENLIERHVNVVATAVLKEMGR